MPTRSSPTRPMTRETHARADRALHAHPPTWLLLETDWASTKQAAPFMPSCSDIVSVGRLRWFEGTTMSGKQNYAWYRFDARHSAGPIFHAHGSAPVSSRVSLCAQCGKPYRPQRSDSRFCSDTCRQRAHRGRLAVTKRDVPARDTESARPTGHARRASSRPRADQATTGRRHAPGLLTPTACRPTRRLTEMSECLVSQRLRREGATVAAAWQLRAC